MINNVVTDGRYGHRILSNNDGHLPEYLKVARQAQLAKVGMDGRSRLKAFRKAMNDNVVQQMGLKSHIPFNAPQYLNLRDLRDLEFHSAAAIQSMIRGYFTRKWYLNYVVRKKLGVPFSGLEFAQNPFMRQFNKPNTFLSQRNHLNDDKLYTAVTKAKETRLTIAKIKKQRPPMPRPDIRIDGDEPIGFKKGQSSFQIISELEKDFLAHGMEAYESFKQLGTEHGIGHDPAGHPEKFIVEDGKVKQELIQGHQPPADSKVYGSAQVAHWIGDQTKAKIFDTSENEAYLRRKNKDYGKKDERPQEGLTLAQIA